ncbi:hypothetical protein KJ780_04280, partial [Candidatus Micrarchaeota archaeon]|nr:hypothetical protein [Candidatus Micrarchaeota archaeon]
EKKQTKSAMNLIKKPQFSKIKFILNSITEEHPKINLLLTLLSKLKNKKSIIFAQYRDQVKLLADELNGIGIQSRSFLGKKDGYTNKQQIQTLEDFRNDVFSVLVASSIGEEGLDIPAVDVVVFYEPIPSEIRSIQRRGRAGRFNEGEIYILMTRDTRDEYFYWASFNRENKMKSILNKMRNKPKSEYEDKQPPLDKDGQSKLTSFF